MNIQTYSCVPHDQPHVHNIDTLWLTVIGYPNDYTVMDRAENRLIFTDAATSIDAVCTYINWLYGRVRACEWDAEEAGWRETSEFIPAALAYDCLEMPLDWELVES